MQYQVFGAPECKSVGSTFSHRVGRERKLTIDTVEIHVLNVPAEGCFPHAKVEVGQVHPWDSLLHQLCQHRVKVLDVPYRLILVREAAGHIGTIDWGCWRFSGPPLAHGDPAPLGPDRA